jgi:cytidylate kinase
MIVTIDGPAGAGKSSAARALASRLGFSFLDTGAMYRAVTLAALRAGVNLHSEEALAGLLPGLHLAVDMDAGRVFLGGEDVSAAIRTAEVTAASRAIAASPLVRRHLGALQRTYAAGRNVVTEGRDQGTVVFPDAACKFFLVADETERARRRQREMLARGESADLDAVLAAQRDRDARDAARAIGPMVPAADAIRLDSTALTAEEVVARMEAEVRRRA